MEIHEFNSTVKELIEEYTVNVNNSEKWYKLIPAQLENIGKLINIELNNNYQWFIFKIQNQEYICGYIPLNYNFTFFNLTDAIKNSDVVFGNLSVLSHSSVIRFINTICSILVFLSKHGRDKFIFTNDDSSRISLYSKFLERSLHSFLPEFVIDARDKEILCYRPLSQKTQVGESFKEIVQKRNLNNFLKIKEKSEISTK
jgi:hypothetical protein